MYKHVYVNCFKQFVCTISHKHKAKTKVLVSKLPHVTTFSLFAKKTTKQKEILEYPTIVEQADKLFEEGKFMETYDLLNTQKFYTDIEVLWRICRVLYKISSEETTNADIKKDLIDEAFKIINLAHSQAKNNPNIHKWMAIILDARSGLEGTAARIKNAELVKQHLLRAQELAPQDFTVLYMLGRWCYNMSSLNWFQRKIVTFLYGHIPETSFEEAHDYFLKAEKLRPRYYLPNTFMLGKVSYQLKQYFRARYYLNEAANLSPKNDLEKKFVLEAKLLAAELEFYDVAMDAIFKTFF